MKKWFVYFISSLVLLVGIGCSSPEEPVVSTTINWETISQLCQQGKATNDFQTSLYAYEEGYTLYQNLPDSAFTQYPFLDSLFFPLANRWKGIRETTKARALFLEALNTLAFTRNDSALLYNQIGLTFKVEGKLSEAIGTYQKGLNFSVISDLSKGYLLSNLAIAAFAIGATDNLVEYCDQAIDLLATENTIATKNAIANMYKTKGQLYFTNGQLNRAEESIDRGIHYAKGKTKSKLVVDKGKLLHTMGQLDESLKAFNYSLQLLIPSFEPDNAIHNPKNKDLYPENALIEALEGKAETFTTYYKVSQDPKWLDALLITYDKIYKVERKMWQLHQFDASKQNLQQAIRKKLEKALAITYQLARYYYAIDKAKATTYLHKAFEIAEQTKSMTLLGVVRQSKAVKFGLPEAQIAQEKTLAAILKAATSNPNNSNHQAQQNYYQFIQQLERDYPAYYQLKYADQAITIPTIQNELLTENQALIEYVSTEKALYSFIIRKDTVILYRSNQASGDHLSNLTKDMTRNGFLKYRTAISTSVEAAKPAKQKYIASANQLYKYLFPWTPDFEGIEHLIIIPDGVLGYVPFDALLTNRKDTTFEALPYLIQKFDLNYSYSATLLQEMSRKKNKPSKTFLGIAPKFQQELISATKTRLAPLNLNKTEIIQLKKIIGSGDLLQDKQATKSNFEQKAENYRLLHLSTHGFANDQQGEQSWIALTPTPSNIQTSLLLTKELYNYQLNADFVSLSACETALGELVNAEGIIGMTRAFSYAGAKSMMTTLWRVDEQNTKIITLNFYTRLKGNATSPSLKKSIALQKAKLDFINSTPNPHPFKWAGHVLIGDNGEVF